MTEIKSNNTGCHRGRQKEKKDGDQVVELVRGRAQLAKKKRKHKDEQYR